MLEVLDGRAQMTPVHIPRPRHMGSTAAAAQAEVVAIVQDVRTRGDEAILSYAERGAVAPVSDRALRVPQDVVSRAPSMVRPEFMDALEVMVERLRRTCERQLEQGWLDRGPDEVVGEIVRPLRRIGVHVPGGRAVYPSSVVMCVTPAQVAGVEGIAVAAPPDDTGEVAEPVLAACALLGVSEVYRMSGAAAIAGLAHGTASVRPVEKIVGRGDTHVTLAKRLVRGWIDTDADPGAAELAIIADGRAAPRILAADLVAQAEHGPNGAHVLITWDAVLADRVISELHLEVAAHERSDDIENALIEGGAAVLVRDLDHALDTANAFAPEHLQLHLEEAFGAIDKVRNAGSVHVGPFSPAPVGDYVGGTNHVLPSGGSARWSSGLSVRDFVKRTYVTGLEVSALERLAPHVEAMAETEGLPGHARALHLRMDPLHRRDPN